MRLSGWLALYSTGGVLLTLYLHSGWHEGALARTKHFCPKQSGPIVDMDGTTSTHMGVDLTRHVQVVA